MPSLRQVLGILRRAGVGPEEISIPTDIYRDVLRQVEEILAGEDQESEPDPGYE